MAAREPGRTPRQVFGVMVRFYRERAGPSRPVLARAISKSVSLVQAIELAFTPQEWTAFIRRLRQEGTGRA